jgi:tRNA-dihydrouridine synthase B
MAGITDAPFRDLVCSFGGVSAVVSEMASSESLIRNSQKTHKRIVNCRDDVLKVVQIFGADIKNMSASAIIGEDSGADIIDINMGCPARKIVSNEAGAALMKNEDLAAKITESVASSVNVPISVKMRLGWDFEHINCLSMAKRLENSGANMVAIHCRTRNQMYSGEADWAAIKQLSNTIKIPYICNGDIKSSEDALNAINQSNAFGIMIGRAALGKPWIIKQISEFLRNKTLIPDPSLQEQLSIVMRHFYSTLEFYGELAGIRIFRKHFCWYSCGLGNSSSFRETINKLDNAQCIEKHVKIFYEKNFNN